MNEITRTDWRALPAGYLSPTQVWAYIQCPACYEAERILKIPKPMNAALMIGRFAHASLAHMRAELIAEPGMILNGRSEGVRTSIRASRRIIPLAGS